MIRPALTGLSALDSAVTRSVANGARVQQTDSKRATALAQRVVGGLRVKLRWKRPTNVLRIRNTGY
jgi:hypothetical protein